MSFYDRGDVFESYRAERPGRSSPNLTMEEPALLAELHDTNWVVDDYFTRGPRERSWHGDTVVWHHRTVEDHVRALTDAGFALTALRECEPIAGAFGDAEGELARRRRIPLFLLLAGVRM